MAADRPARRLLAVTLALGALVTSAAAAPARSDAPRPAVPRARDLVQSGQDQQRWLSIPHSRIVLEPYDFDSRQSAVEQSTGPELPMSVGYYAGDQASTVRDVLTLHERPAGEPPDVDVEIGFEDTFDALDPAWVAEPGVDARATDGQLHMALPAEAPNPWGALSRELTVDLDTYSQLRITVPEVEGQWALKVTDGSDPVDIVLQSDTDRTGTFTYDVSEVTGWTGTKTFTVRLFVVQKEKALRVDELRLQSRPPAWLRSAKTFSTTWAPYALSFDAEYASGRRLRGQDFFHDTDSVTRALTVENAPGDGSTVAISGTYRGTVSYDRDRHTLLVAHGPYRYAVVLPDAEGDVEYYADESMLVAGGPRLPEPGTSGYWTVRLRLDEERRARSVVGLGFGTTDEPTDTVVQRARAAATRPGAATDPARWERFWDQRLARVPHPEDFSLAVADTKGVTPSDVRLMYYRAWVFLLADVLPPEPEVGYGFPQLAAGKPSMWNFGADGARASASWDSLLGMQYLAYVDPDTAWDAYEGLMTLVDDDGMLGGESLPSRKAQTAWVLHSVTGDTARLRSTYAALRRHLLWARENPRWIFGDHDDPNERDAEFVVSLLLDFRYAAEIASVLGDDEDVSFWHRQYDEFFADYLTWFWETPTSEPRQYYFLDTGRESPGNTLWVTTGLHLESVPSDQLTGLKNRFLAEYDPDGELAGFDFPDVKAPDVTWTTYGLLEKGMLDQAQGFVEVVLRDMVRSGEFAEVYERGPDGPRGTGVRPSLFGAVNVVDFVWLRNGYRMDAGDPRFVLMPGERGGIRGLRFGDRTLDVDIDAASGRVRLGGSLVRSTPSCRTLELPLGRTAAIPEACRVTR